MKAIKTRGYLYGKQGRGCLFYHEERDSPYKQIETFETQMRDKNNLLKRLEKDIKDAEKNYDNDLKAINKSEQDTQNKLKRIEELSKRLMTK